MSKRGKWSLSTIVVVTVISIGVCYSANVNAEENQKPVGGEHQTYNLNPEPVLKNNENQSDKLLLKKEKILYNFKVENNDKVISTELKTWKDYNDTEGDKGKNFEVADKRLVYVVKVFKPDGVDTRGGFYKNATVTNVIDAETGKQIEMFVNGELDPKSVPFNNPIVGEDKK